MYRYGFSSTVGVWLTVVYGGLGKLCPGTPVSPTNTMFQFEPVQLPSWSLRMMNCCWVPELTWPVTTESLMKPPDDQLLVVLPEVSSSSTMLPSILHPAHRVGLRDRPLGAAGGRVDGDVLHAAPEVRRRVPAAPGRVGEDPAAGDHRLGRVLPEADDLGVEADRDADVVGAGLEHQLIALGAELVRLLRVVDRVDVVLDRRGRHRGGEHVDVRSRSSACCPWAAPPLGSVHCWLALSAQAQICTWVPEPPKPVSSRHLPELGLSSSPLDCGTQTWAPVPLQVYRSTRVPLAVPAPLTSRHMPSTCRVLPAATVHCCALVPLQV